VVQHASRTTARHLTLDSTGQFALKWPAAATVGDSLSLALELPTGDTVTATSRVRGVMVHLGSSQVTGQTLSGGTVTVQVFGSRGRLASATALTDPALGTFSVAVLGRQGRPLHLSAGMRIVMEDAIGSVEETIPRLTIQRTASVSRVRLAADARRLVMYTIDLHGRRRAEQVALGASGASLVKLDHADQLHSVVASTLPVDGISFERTLRIEPRAACRKSTSGKRCRTLTAGKHVR
jgi:hypothetical protein